MLDTGRVAARGSPNMRVIVLGNRFHQPALHENALAFYADKADMFPQFGFNWEGLGTVWSEAAICGNVAI